MGKRHFKSRHFSARHLATQHLAGSGSVEPPEEEEKPQQVGAGSIDRNRAKRIGTFPALPRFRTRKKRDEELLIFL
jgi:hypothetical protein